MPQFAGLLMGRTRSAAATACGVGDRRRSHSGSLSARLLVARCGDGVRPRSGPDRVGLHRLRSCRWTLARYRRRDERRSDLRPRRCRGHYGIAMAARSSALRATGSRISGSTEVTSLRTPGGGPRSASSSTLLPPRSSPSRSSRAFSSTLRESCAGRDSEHRRPSRNREGTWPWPHRACRSGLDRGRADSGVGARPRRVRWRTRGCHHGCGPHRARVRDADARGASSLAHRSTSILGARPRLRHRRRGPCASHSRAE